MTRFVIDAATLVHLVDQGLRADPGHQLLAPNRIRAQARVRRVQDGVVVAAEVD